MTVLRAVNFFSAKYGGYRLSLWGDQKRSVSSGAWVIKGIRWKWLLKVPVTCVRSIFVYQTITFRN
jgi:hypothetical protein